MNRRTTVAAAAVAVTMAASSWGFLNARAAPGDDLQTTLSSVREHERLSADLYAAIADHYEGETHPFTRLAVVEQRHVDRVDQLLARRGVAEPTTTVGVFSDPELQATYDGWLTRAEESLTAAYQVGAEVEQADIDELSVAIETSAEPTVDAVLGNLQQASQQHLDSFTRLAAGEPLTMTDTGTRNGWRRQATDDSQSQPGTGSGSGRGNGDRTGAGLGAGPGDGTGVAPRDGTGFGPGSGTGRGQGMGPGGGTGTCLNG